MADESKVLETIKRAETFADRKAKEAEGEAARIIEAAKGEVPKIQARAIKGADEYRSAALGRAEKAGAEERRRLIGEWGARAKRLREPDRETVMQMFRKALKERFGV